MIELKKAAQPDLPVLKNNKQREKFLEDYRFWPVWFQTPEAAEICFRYELPDGTAIAVREKKGYAEWKEKYADMQPEYTTQEWYLLRPGYRYLADCHTSKTQLVEHLKEVQKV